MIFHYIKHIIVHTFRADMKKKTFYSPFISIWKYFCKTSSRKIGRIRERFKNKQFIGPFIRMGFNADFYLIFGFSGYTMRIYYTVVCGYITEINDLCFPFGDVTLHLTTIFSAYITNTTDLSRWGSGISADIAQLFDSHNYFLK